MSSTRPRIRPPARQPRRRPLASAGARAAGGDRSAGRRADTAAGLPAFRPLWSAVAVGLRGLRGAVARVMGTPESRLPALRRTMGPAGVGVRRLRSAAVWRPRLALVG